MEISEEMYRARESARARYLEAAEVAYAAIFAARAAKTELVTRLEAEWVAACAAEGCSAERRLDPEIARTDRRAFAAGLPYTRASHRAEEHLLLAMRGSDELADMVQLAPTPGNEFRSLAREAAVSWRYVRDVAARGYPFNCRPWAAIVEAASAAAEAAEAYAAT